jgi:hypothetical protein
VDELLALADLGSVDTGDPGPRHDSLWLGNVLNDHRNLPRAIPLTTLHIEVNAIQFSRYHPSSTLLSNSIRVLARLDIYRKGFRGARASRCWYNLRHQHPDYLSTPLWLHRMNETSSLRQQLNPSDQPPH